MHAKFLKAARRNVERNLADALTEDMLTNEGTDAFYETCYTLAYDGAVDAGATPAQAREIAEKVKLEQ